MIRLLIFLSVFSLALATDCYDCDGEDVCVNPEKNNVKTNSNFKYCFEFFLKVTDNSTSIKSGAYRGGKNLDNPDGKCEDWKNNPSQFKEGLQGEISNCRICEENKCNKNEMNGSASLSFSFLTVLIGSFMCFYLSDF